MRSLFSFNQERLNSQYSFYQGEETRIYTLGHPNIIGMGGPTSTPGALPPICAINLFISGQKVQYYLKQIDCPKVIPILSEGNVRGSVIALYLHDLRDPERRFVRTMYEVESIQKRIGNDTISKTYIAAPARHVLVYTSLVRSVTGMSFCVKLRSLRHIGQVLDRSSNHGSTHGGWN